MSRILSIQDISCVGQCSLTVALPIISACGVETCILPSAVLSNHTGGFQGFTFRDLTDDFKAIQERWILEGIDFDAIYTGYLGSIYQIDLVKDLIKKLLVKDGKCIIDPVMADHGKLYKGFDMEYVKEMRKLCADADVILPNITEAAFLTQSECILENHKEGYINALLKKLSFLGAKKVILKGIRYQRDIGEDTIGVIIYESATGRKEYYQTQRVLKNAHGTGDCFASAFTGAWLQGKTECKAVQLAADFVVECLEKTQEGHWYGVQFEKAIPMLVRELAKI